ncbi:MAG: hypothetical protein ACRDZT_06495, partial [Acidimicrobiales bacterium]
MTAEAVRAESGREHLTASDFEPAVTANERDLRTCQLSGELATIAREVQSEVARLLSNEAGAVRAETAVKGLERDDARARAGVLVQHVLDSRAAAALGRGERPLDLDQELLIRDLALAMLFGLGVLQLFVEDPAVENVDVNGADRAFVTYADGRKTLV